MDHPAYDEISFNFSKMYSKIHKFHVLKSWWNYFELNDVKKERICYECIKRFYDAFLIKKSLFKISCKILANLKLKVIFFNSCIQQLVENIFAIKLIPIFAINT